MIEMYERISLEILRFFSRKVEIWKFLEHAWIKIVASLDTTDDRFENVIFQLPSSCSQVRLQLEREGGEKHNRLDFNKFQRDISSRYNSQVDVTGR